MSTQDASLKEGNYDDAAVFYPERWLKGDAKEYHAFASIPFGFGARKCLGQNMSELLLSLLTIRVSGDKIFKVQAEVVCFYSTPNLAYENVVGRNTIHVCN